MEKIKADAKLNIKIQDKAYFQSDTHINLESTDVKKILTEVIQSTLDKIGIYQKNAYGSGWYFKEVIHLEIHTVDFKPMRGSSYISLPDWIMRKKAIKNIKNNDDKCFLWCVLRYLHPNDINEHRLTDLKQYVNTLNTKGIKFPVKLKDIPKFESLNPSLGRSEIPTLRVYFTRCYLMLTFLDNGLTVHYDHGENAELRQRRSEKVRSSAITHKNRIQGGRDWVVTQQTGKMTG